MHIILDIENEIKDVNNEKNIVKVESRRYVL